MNTKIRYRVKTSFGYFSDTDKHGKPIVASEALAYEMTHGHAHRVVAQLPAYYGAALVRVKVKA